jgi:hypothetical protein
MPGILDPATKYPPRLKQSGHLPVSEDWYSDDVMDAPPDLGLRLKSG